MWCFGSGKRRRGKGWTSWAASLHHLRCVRTDWQVAGLSLYKTTTDCCDFLLKCINLHSVAPFLSSVNTTVEGRVMIDRCKLTVLREIQRLLRDRRAEGLCRLIEEEDGVFDANGKGTTFISTMDSSVLTCILCGSNVRQTPLSAGTRTKDILTHWLHHGQCFGQFFPYKGPFQCHYLQLISPCIVAPPALVLSPQTFLPAVACLEPELQCCVFVFTPLAVDIGLVVIIALQAFQQWRLWEGKRKCCHHNACLYCK